MSKKYTTTYRGTVYEFDTGKHCYIATGYFYYIDARKLGDKFYELVNFTHVVALGYGEEARRYFKHLNYTLSININRLCRFIIDNYDINDITNLNTKDVLYAFLESGYKHEDETNSSMEEIV